MASPSLCLSLCLFTLEYRCFSPSLSLSLGRARSLTRSVFHLRLPLASACTPSFQFVSDLKTEGRSIGRFSSGFSSATTTPRRVEKLLSGLPIRAWKKIQVDRTHSREKDGGKEWEREGWAWRAAGGKRCGGKRNRRVRVRRTERGN